MRPVIGTSGFAYRHWKGIFYPDNLSTREWLEYYARHFNGVEINSTFYHLPTEAVIRSWSQRTPANFTFVLKGSRFVTHQVRLQRCGDSIRVFYRRTEPLHEKMAAILWQLPPEFDPDPALLDRFLALLPSAPRPVIEFRDPRCYSAAMMDKLRRRGACLCLHDMSQCRPPDELTSEMTYMRFHGYGTRYGGSYPDQLLHERADWIQRTGARQVLVFFNNDREGYAIENARRMREYLRTWGRRGSPPP